MRNRKWSRSDGFRRCIFKNCDFNNLKVKTDMGDLCFIGKEDVMRTWNIQVNTDMGDINVDDALTGKMVEDPG